VEDYLQEFGRAGRDGRPAVAVLFTGPKDAGLLRFMAEKTLQASGTQEPDALHEKYRAIETMRRQALGDGNCFRAAIVSYFGETPPTASRTLAERIVAWLFERGSTSQASEHCCDACDRVTVRNVSDWASQVWMEHRKRS